MLFPRLKGHIGFKIKIWGRLEGGRRTRRTLTTDNASKTFILKPVDYEKVSSTYCLTIKITSPSFSLADIWIIVEGDLFDFIWSNTMISHVFHSIFIPVERFDLHGVKVYHTDIMYQ